jgi:glucokinase
MAEITTARRFLVVTVSSGIGSKMFVRESGVLDDLPFGGEIGHIVVDHSHSSLICDCGAKGHLGAVASGRGVERRARMRAADDASKFRASKVFLKFRGTPQHLTNEQHLVPAILDGDPWALHVLRDCTLPLAQVLVLIAVAAGLDRVFVMGGFAQAIGKRYLDLLRALASHSSRFDVTQDRVDSMFDFAPRGGEICLEGCLAFLRNADRLGVSSGLVAVESDGAMQVAVET